MQKKCKILDLGAVIKHSWWLGLMFILAIYICLKIPNQEVIKDKKTYLQRIYVYSSKQPFLKFWFWRFFVSAWADVADILDRILHSCCPWSASLGIMKLRRHGLVNWQKLGYICCYCPMNMQLVTPGSNDVCCMSIIS